MIHRLFIKTHLLSLKVIDQMLPKFQKMGTGVTILIHCLLTITLIQQQKE